jgi:hypothetical protein
MKTVQQHLRELDLNRLIAAYFFEHPIEYNHPAFSGLTVSQIKQRYTDGLCKFIQRLCSIAPKDDPDGKVGILLAHRCIEVEHLYRTEGYCLIQADEVLLDWENAKPYAYEFTDQSEIVGFLVADSEYTRRHIYDLMADVLYQASFFGYEQEGLTKAREDLDRSIREAKEGDVLSMDEVMKECFPEHKSERTDPDEKKLRDTVMKAAFEYNEHFKKKELALLYRALRNNKRNGSNESRIQSIS